MLVGALFTDGFWQSLLLQIGSTVVLVGPIVWLEESFRRHEDVLLSVATDPRMDSLRNEPRFLSLLQKMGFTKN